MIKPLTNKEMEDLMTYDQLVNHWQEKWSKETVNQKERHDKNVLWAWWEASLEKRTICVLQRKSQSSCKKKKNH